MSETTEIYICKPGQSIRNGRLEYSSHINDKAQAEQDARERCRLDKKIGKIAYYRVTDEGDFKVFYSYTNPDAKGPVLRETRPAPKAPPAKTGGKKKPAAAPKKKGALGRIGEFFRD